MGGVRMQEIACCDAVCICGRIEGATIAGHPVVNARPLGMIEDIECFGAELEPLSFGNSKAFKQRHIEVGPPWISQEVSPRIAKRQAAGRGEGSRIEQQGPRYAFNESRWRR